MVYWSLDLITRLPPKVKLYGGPLDGKLEMIDENISVWHIPIQTHRPIFDENEFPELPATEIATYMCRENGEWHFEGMSVI
jgi:hypothetical protein